MPNYWVIRKDAEDVGLIKGELVDDNRTLILRSLKKRGQVDEEEVEQEEEIEQEVEETPHEFGNEWGVCEGDQAIVVHGDKEQRQVIGKIKFISTPTPFDEEQPHFTTHPYEQERLLRNYEVFSYKSAIEFSRNDGFVSYPLKNLVYSLPKRSQNISRVFHKAITKSYELEFTILLKQYIYYARSIFYQSFFALSKHHRRLWLIQVHEDGKDIHNDPYHELAIHILEFIKNELGESGRYLNKVNALWHSLHLEGDGLFNGLSLSLETTNNGFRHLNVFTQSLDSIRENKLGVFNEMQSFPIIDNNEEDGFVQDIQTMQSFITYRRRPELRTRREEDWFFEGRKLSWTRLPLKIS